MVLTDYRGWKAHRVEIVASTCALCCILRKPVLQRPLLQGGCRGRIATGRYHVSILFNKSISTTRKPGWTRERPGQFAVQSPRGTNALRLVMEAPSCFILCNGTTVLTSCNDIVFPTDCCCCAALFDHEMLCNGLLRVYYFPLLVLCYIVYVWV